jgi:hypothetical protein
MADKTKAISITDSFIKSHINYNNYIVDVDDIQEHETLWYVPFKQKEPTNDFIVGAHSGLIVDKSSDDFMQPGSGRNVKDWFYGFKIGLRGGRYDLIINRVPILNDALDMLDKIGLTYVRIEVENNTEWKIPKRFNRKELKKRLEDIPCSFKNQSFTFAADHFKEIRNRRIFDYDLLKTKNTNPNILGELLED